MKFDFSPYHERSGHRTGANGFSLVELSIVLVILGLLTGGILTGQTLIRASELRAVTTEFQRFQSAANTFRDKYFGTPGDLRNAEDFWGQQAAGATCATASSTTTATCNGDGDGRVELTGLGVTNSNEGFRFWQHLANAGLIEGTFTGVSCSGGPVDCAVGGENAPRSKLGTGTWLTRYLWMDTITGQTDYFDGSYGNMFQIGAQTTNNDPNTPLFVPEEAWNIDTKMDDGMPATGMVMARIRANCTNATAAVADSDNFDSVYNLTDSATRCALVFRNAY